MPSAGVTLPPPFYVTNTKLDILYLLVRMILPPAQCIPVRHPAPFPLLDALQRKILAEALSYFLVLHGGDARKKGPAVSRNGPHHEQPSWPGDARYLLDIGLAGMGWQTMKAADIEDKVKRASGCTVRGCVPALNTW
jgi:hypothetical protein